MIEPEDQVFIRDLSVQGVIGIEPWERENAQEIRIDVVLFTDTRRAGRSDAIADCVDYARMTDRVLAHARSARRFTVEALAADVARLCLDAPRVVRVRVRVAKPTAVAAARSVGVEIERSRESLDDPRR